MDQNYTHITLVVDRSGSMAAIKDDAEGGINTFIKEQAQKAGKCTLTLVEFDDKYKVVFDGKPIQEIANYTLSPCGNTALLDAVGRAINSTGERLASMDEKDRPGLVILIIVTDGQENSSREFSKDKIKEMITHQKDIYKWQFTFLGADENAFADAANIGITRDCVAQYSPGKINAAYKGVCDNVLRMRSSIRSGAEVENKFTEQERNSMK